MSNITLLILRVGLGLTFFITGIHILRSKDMWVHMLPISLQKKYSRPTLRSLMAGTALYDLVNGVWLVSGVLLGYAALFAAFHLLLVLLSSNRHTFHETYRDIGLFATSVAVAMQVFP
jgi:uncharacterized membrane protein YphA (DoxX/SURF4 family)